MNSDASRIKIFVNLIVLCVSFWGISQKDYLSDDPSFFEEMVIRIVSPVQNKITKFGNGVNYYLTHYTKLVDVSKSNVELGSEINELRMALVEAKEVVRENKRLKKLLNFKINEKQSKVMAQVVAWDANSNFKTLRINKGKEAGIKTFDTVITAEGLVGYVYRATKTYSDVLTILDQNNRVDALVGRTRSHGIVEGHSDLYCHMKYVSRTEPIKLNDLILTSGLSRIYPKGILVGLITQIKRESFGTTQFIEVSPAVNFDKLEEVVVLVDKKGPKVGVYP